MPRLHHVALRVSDLERSVRFYTRGLGLGEPYLWNAPPHVEAAAFLPTGQGGWIELFGLGPGAQSPAADESQGGMAHLALAYDDVQAAFDRAVAEGATALQAPETRTLHGTPPIQATLAFVSGPDNEVIEIYRNDHLPFAGEPA
jgi:catechol 2,3-dioxygenase-like lactoylglutathione lyase family enzyme